MYSTLKNAVPYKKIQFTYFLPSKVKNHSLYRPGQGLRVPGGWGAQISRRSAHDGGKVVIPTHRPTLPSGNIPGIYFFWKLSRPHGHSAAGRIMSMRSSTDTIGNRIAQCLNQLPHRVPPTCPQKKPNVNHTFYFWSYISISVCEFFLCIANLWPYCKPSPYCSFRITDELRLELSILYQCHFEDSRPLAWYRMHDCQTTVNERSEKFMVYKAVEELNQLHVWRGRVDGIVEY